MWANAYYKKQNSLSLFLKTGLTPSYETHSRDSRLVFRAKQVQGSQKLPLCREYVMNNIHLGVPQLICSSSLQLHPNRKQILCSCEE